MAQQTTTKRCPDCAEEILAEAQVCRYCGYDYRTGTRAAGPVGTNGMAVASMVLGIIGFVLFFIPFLLPIMSILALVLGHSAKRQIQQSGGRESGRPMAVAGIVLGWVGVAISILVFLFLFVSVGSEVHRSGRIERILVP